VYLPNNIWIRWLVYALRTNVTDDGQTALYGEMCRNRRNRLHRLKCIFGHWALDYVTIKRTQTVRKAVATTSHARLSIVRVVHLACGAYRLTRRRKHVKHSRLSFCTFSQSSSTHMKRSLLRLFSESIKPSRKHTNGAYTRSTVDGAILFASQLCALLCLRSEWLIYAKTLRWYNVLICHVYNDIRKCDCVNTVLL